MLTELRIENFKAWKDTGRLRMAPLTVIFGVNSAGKSSLGQLLMALKQTVMIDDPSCAFHLGDAGSPIELGRFRDCLHNHDLAARLGFSLGWKLPEPIAVTDSTAPGATRQGDHLELSSSLRANQRGNPQLDHFSYRLLEGDEERLRVTHGQGENGDVFLHIEPPGLTTPHDASRPLDPPEKFYRFADSTQARYGNLQALGRFAEETERLFAGLIHLGPMRDAPRRGYRWNGEHPADVGERGQHALAALLAAAREGRELCRGEGVAKARFDAFIAAWLRDLGVIDSFAVHPRDASAGDFDVLVRTYRGAPQVTLADVGFGVSQILPALVQAFHAPPWSTVWMEQPEIHLHPQVQAELADVFISAVQAWENGKPRQVQLVVESHSMHFLLRLQRRIAEQAIAARDVAVYFASRSAGGSELEALRLNAYGEIENWPENFFGDELGEIAARAQAAIARRRREKEAGDE